MSVQSIVIVGGGLAASRAAETLRAEGYGGALDVVADEPHLPYERPPLSKEVLKGEQQPGDSTTHDAGWWSDHDVTMHLGVAATSIDRDACTVSLSDGSTLGYDRLLLATGARPRRLQVPGCDLDGVHLLRTRDDAAALSAALEGTPRVVVVGGGWIGLEVASAAVQRGADVTVCTPQSPLVSLVGEEISTAFAELHRRHGARVLVGAEVGAIRGGPRVTGVVVGGETLPADVVVVGIGVLPNDDLARSAGLPVGDGVLVDARFRTADPRIFAAGDVARFEQPPGGSSMRVEHWANALNGGTFAARSMLGSEEAWDRLPYFFSDQYDVGLEGVGALAPEDDAELVVRGDVAALELVAFWLVDGVLRAAMHVNTWDATEPLKQLISSARRLDPARLADPSVPLDQVFA